MGKTYLFECGHCGYRAAVSGGPDAGLEVKVQTARCRDCRALFDGVVAVRLRGNPDLPSTASAWWKKPEEPAPALAAVLARLPSPATAGRRWRTFALTCPSNPTHRVEPWHAPGRCPRCGDYLEPSALPYRRWD